MGCWAMWPTFRGSGDEAGGDGLKDLAFEEPFEEVEELHHRLRLADARPQEPPIGQAAAVPPGEGSHLVQRELLVLAGRDEGEMTADVLPTLLQRRGGAPAPPPQPPPPGGGPGGLPRGPSRPSPNA